MSRQNLNSSRGFTLLEILVVLVIVAVMAGLLVVGFKDSPQQRVRREAQSLAALLNAVSDEAVMRGVELGLVIDDSGYQFVYFDPEKKQWQPARERALARHQFTEPYAIEFSIDGAAVDDNTRQRMQAFVQLSEDVALRPALLILSSGELTPFRLTLSVNEEEPVVLMSDGINPVVVVHAQSADAAIRPAGAQG
jgi:general secretion pathway protein H